VVHPARDLQGGYTYSNFLREIKFEPYAFYVLDIFYVNSWKPCILNVDQFFIPFFC